MSDSFSHAPVLLKESIELLNIKPGGTYVDCTLGGGGHAAAMLRNDKCSSCAVSQSLRKLRSMDQVTNVKLIGIDLDQDALEAAEKRLAQFNNIEFVKDNFANIKKIVKEPVDGILFDLGISSHQIDTASRGFSIREDGLLDMRMDKKQKLTAAGIVNSHSQDELERIFREFSEERFARRVAKAIIDKRQGEEIKTTHQLKNIIEKAIPTWRKRESVTRIFQGLRIAVNCELDTLKKALADALELLKLNGRIVVLSYHSLEDRIVKHTFRQAKAEGKLEILTKKPITASAAEITSNPRARSAKLRAGAKR